MTLLIDAPPGYDESPGPDGSITCRQCDRDVTREPCPRHGPASTVDNRIDYERLAALAHLVMVTRRATGDDFAAAARESGLTLTHLPLLERWGVLGRDGRGWLVRIHAAHVDLVRSEIVRRKGLPPAVSPLLYLAMPALTTRQREVIELAAEGLDNEGIAGRLFITPDTVKHHISRGMHALGATNRTNLVHRSHLAGVFGAIPQQPAAATDA